MERGEHEQPNRSDNEYFHYSCGKILGVGDNEPCNFRYSWGVDFSINYDEGINWAKLHLAMREGDNNSLNRDLIHKDQTLRPTSVTADKTVFQLPGISFLSQSPEFNGTYPSFNGLGACGGKAVRSSSLTIFGRFRFSLPNSELILNARQLAKNSLLTPDNAKGLILQLFANSHPNGFKGCQPLIVEFPTAQYNVVPLKDLNNLYLRRHSARGFALREDRFEIPLNKMEFWYAEWQLLLPPIPSHSSNPAIPFGVANNYLDLLFTYTWPTLVDNGFVASGTEVEDDLGPMQITIPSCWLTSRDQGRQNPNSSISCELVELIVDPECNDSCG